MLWRCVVVLGVLGWLAAGALLFAAFVSWVERQVPPDA